MGLGEEGLSQKAEKLGSRDTEADFSVINSDISQGQERAGKGQGAIAPPKVYV